jgi:hypothetical protein
LCAHFSGLAGLPGKSDISGHTQRSFWSYVPSESGSPLGTLASYTTFHSFFTGNTGWTHVTCDSLWAIDTHDVTYTCYTYRSGSSKSDGAFQPLVDT